MPSASKSRLDRSRTGQEEADPVLVREGRHGVLLLAGHVERLAARHEHVEIRARGEELGHAAAASTTCSKLSSRSSIDLSPTCSASPFLAPTTCAAAREDELGSGSAASGTQQTPSG